MSFCKKTQEVYQMYFMAVKKSRKKFWFSDLFKDSLQQFKGMQSSKLGRWTVTGYHLWIEGIQKGYHIYQK